MLERYGLSKNFFFAGNFFQASKFSGYETGYYNFRTQLQNFFGSRGYDVNSVVRGRKNFFVRLNLNRCVVDFLLVCLDGGEIGSGGKNKFCTGKADYVNWSFAEIDNGVCCLGSGSSHFD